MSIVFSGDVRHCYLPVHLHDHPAGAWRHPARRPGRHTVLHGARVGEDAGHSGECGREKQSNRNPERILICTTLNNLYTIYPLIGQGRKRFFIARILIRNTLNDIFILQLARLKYIIRSQ